MQQLIPGLIAEGTTDVRFLTPVISKVLTEIAFSATKQIEVFEPCEVTARGETFVEKMLNACSNSASSGVTILFIHADADHRSAQDVLKNKFQPLLNALDDMSADTHCKHIVPTIPVQMIESWMLADKELFKRLINASDKQDSVLGIEKLPESYADPKSVINSAIRHASAGKTRSRRNNVTISDLYRMLGERLELDKLRAIPSFIEFEDNVKSALRGMGIFT